MRVTAFLLSIFLAGYVSGHIYGTTEEDAYERPWEYPSEPVEYVVWVKYKNQTLRYEAKNYKQVLKIASKNPGAIIIYQIKNNGVKHEI